MGGVIVLQLVGPRAPRGGKEVVTMLRSRFLWVLRHLPLPFFAPSILPPQGLNGRGRASFVAAASGVLQLQVVKDTRDVRTGFFFRGVNVRGLRKYQHYVSRVQVALVAIWPAGPRFLSIRVGAVFPRSNLPGPYSVRAHVCRFPVFPRAYPSFVRV